MRLLSFLILPTILYSSPIRNSLTLIDLLYNHSFSKRILWGNGYPIGSIQTCNNESYLSFRGTLSIFDWLSDLDDTLTPYPNGGRVSRGFLNLYTNPYHLTTNNNICKFPPIWNYCLSNLGTLEQVLRKTSIREEILSINNIKYIAGHSLGGALAILAATDIPTARVVYALGSPMVGDPEFAEKYNQYSPRTYLIHTIDDIVPNFPMPCYRYVGNRVVLEMLPGVCNVHSAHSMERYWESIDTLDKLEFL